MTNRQLDIAVAQLLGLDVLGEAPCLPGYTGNTWDVSYDGIGESIQMQLVYLRGCSCFCEEPGDKKYFGHIAGCLEVVPFYHLDHEQAFAAATRLGLFGEQQDGSDVVYYCAGGEHLVCCIDWPGEEMCVVSSAETVPLAICKALAQLGEQDDE